jgi:flagellar protein FlaG
MLVGLLDSLPPSPTPVREGVVVPALPGAAAAAQAPAAPPTASVVDAAVTAANAVLRSVSNAVEFEYDPDVNVTVIRLVDTSDHQVLRQIPSPEMLEIARALERMQVMLVHNKA